MSCITMSRALGYFQAVAVYLSIHTRFQLDRSADFWQYHFDSLSSCVSYLLSRTRTVYGPWYAETNVNWSADNEFWK